MNARTATCAAVVAVVLAGAGCGRRTPAAAAPTSRPATSAPASLAAPPSAVPLATEPGFDYTDPGRVCRAMTAALFSADTTTDTGPADAYRRATRYMDAGRAVRPGADRDGRWQTWAAHQARMSVQVSDHHDLEQPPDDSLQAYRAARITATPVGADGWRGWTENDIVYCTLRRDGAQWRVADYTISPLPGPS